MARVGLVISPRLFALAAGVVVSHTLVTILEEKLFSQGAFTNAAGGAFMTFFMYVFAALCYTPSALRARRSAGGSGSANGAKFALLQVAIIYVGTTTLTKTSLRYIDMPSQTVLKSAKLLPVMAGSIIILGKRFTRQEWMAAAMLCTGIALFNLSTHFPKLRQTLAGTTCIVIALVCDALLGPYQKRVLSEGVTVAELMHAQSAFGGVAMLVTCIADGTLMPGLSLFVTNPSVAAALVTWAVAITLGTSLVLRLVDEYSAVTAIVVTTARKALTLFASFLLFPKHVGLGHPVGAALVFGSAFITMKKPAKRPLLPTNMRAV